MIETAREIGVFVIYETHYKQRDCTAYNDDDKRTISTFNKVK